MSLHIFAYIKWKKDQVDLLESVHLPFQLLSSTNNQNNGVYLSLFNDTIILQYCVRIATWLIE